MPGRAISNRAKRNKVSVTEEAKVQKAVDAYHIEQANPGKKRSIREIAKVYGVSKSKLQRWVTGGQGLREFNATKQKLTPVEEHLLVEFILESADLGFPMSHRQIKQYADAAREARLGVGCEKVGKEWVFAFIDRHRQRLRTHWSKPLDTQRARSLNPEALESWWKLLEKYVVGLGVTPDRLYGMDESGFPTGYTGKERVIGARETKTQHKQGGASRQNITALVTIRGDGQMIVPPMLIFPGQNFQSVWNKGNIVNAFIAKSETGWTHGELGVEWLIKVFDAATKTLANGKPRVLLLDGHSSHYTPKFVDYARENNIILLGYPPHCTHALQGLDVVCFAKMKTCWQREIIEWEAVHMGRTVGKGDFTALWCKAYLAAFDEATVRTAFRITGVVPFDPTVISKDKLKPSEATSTKGEFPLPQPSPVKAIQQAMRLNPPTTFQLSPSHNIPAASPEAGPSCFRGAMDTTSSSPVSTPSRKRTREVDENIDPSLVETPSKRMRFLYSEMAMTSGSILLSKSKITSTTIAIRSPVIQQVPSCLPTPDWSLATPRPSSRSSYYTKVQYNQQIDDLQRELRSAQAQVKVRDAIIEGQNATMVYQNLHLHKTNQALFEKENPQKNDRTHLFNGKAQCLSSDEFAANLHALEKAKKEEEKRKKSARDTRASRKALQEQLDIAWQMTKKNHVEEMTKWEQQCARLLETGIKKRDLPAKPKISKKPQLPPLKDVNGGLEEREDENVTLSHGCPKEPE